MSLQLADVWLHFKIVFYLLLPVRMDCFHTRQLFYSDLMQRIENLQKCTREVSENLRIIIISRDGKNYEDSKQ